MTTRSIPLTSFDRLAASFFARPYPQLARQIPLDAVQRGDGLHLAFDLPGVAESDVDLTIERRVLTVKAERPDLVQEGDHVFVAERASGPMSRQIVLGDTLDLDRVEATFDHGVLRVFVPVAATALSRRVEIGHAPVETTASEVEASTES
jgi:HSP20 family protein